MHVCVDISDLFLKQATVLTGSQTDRLEACDLKESKQTNGIPEVYVQPFKMFS